MVTSLQANSKALTLYSDLSNDDSIPDETLSIVDVKSNYHGEFKTVTPSWQREKCKVIRLTFTTGILYIKMLGFFCLVFVCLFVRID